MATIRCRYAAAEIQLTPVAPTTNGARDAYRLAYSEHGTVLFESRYPMPGTQDGHYEMRRVARAFHSAPRLAGLRLPLDLGDSDDANDPFFAERPVLLFGPEWMRVSMEPVPAGPDRDTDSAVATTWLVRPRRQRRGPLARWLQFSLVCTMAEAAQFGEELWSELMDAQRRRAELGIAAPTDWDEVDLAPGEVGQT